MEYRDCMKTIAGMCREAGHSGSSAIADVACALGEGIAMIALLAGPEEAQANFLDTLFATVRERTTVLNADFAKFRAERAKEE